MHSKTFNVRIFRPNYRKIVTVYQYDCIEEAVSHLGDAQVLEIINRSVELKARAEWRDETVRRLVSGKEVDGEKFE